MSYPQWRHYPSWRTPGSWAKEVVGLVATAAPSISSTAAHLESNKVLAELRPALEAIGFQVEGNGPKLARPVLYGDEGQVVKSFNVDAFRADDGTALEVESGGAVYNNRILLDLFKFSLGMDVERGVILVPLRYETPQRAWQDPIPRLLSIWTRSSPTRSG